jgi:hypothetical protein
VRLAARGGGGAWEAAVLCDLHPRAGGARQRSQTCSKRLVQRVTGYLTTHGRRRPAGGSPLPAFRPPPTVARASKLQLRASACARHIHDSAQEAPRAAIPRNGAHDYFRSLVTSRLSTAAHHVKIGCFTKPPNAKPQVQCTNLSIFRTTIHALTVSNMASTLPRSQEAHIHKQALATETSLRHAIETHRR